MCTISLDIFSRYSVALEKAHRVAMMTKRMCYEISFRAFLSRLESSSVKPNGNMKEQTKNVLDYKKEGASNTKFMTAQTITATKRPAIQRITFMWHPTTDFYLQCKVCQTICSLTKYSIMKLSIDV